MDKQTKELAVVDANKAVEICQLLLTGRATTAMEISEILGLEQAEVLRFMTDPVFTKNFLLMRRNSGLNEYYAKAFDRIMADFENADNVKDRVRASQELREILGLTKKEKAGTTVNVNIDQLVRQIGKDALDADESWAGYDE